MKACFGGEPEACHDPVKNGSLKNGMDDAISTDRVRNHRRRQAQKQAAARDAQAQPEASFPAGAARVCAVLVTVTKPADHRRAL